MRANEPSAAAALALVGIVHGEDNGTSKILAAWMSVHKKLSEETTPTQPALLGEAPSHG
jgi:hypothetical protein